MRLLFAVLFLFSVNVFAQEQRGLTLNQIKEIQTELMRQKFIRIVESVIHPFQIFDSNSYIGIQYDVFRNCGRRIFTDSGQARVNCDANPKSLIWFHGGPIEDMWGDRVIDVTILGYDTHEQLCHLDYSNPSPKMRFCSDENRDNVEPVISAHISLITKVYRFTKEDEVRNDALIKETGGMISTSSYSGNLKIPKIKSGEVRIWEVASSKVTYKFLKLEK